MSLIAGHYDPAVPLGGLGGEQVGRLGHQPGLEVAGLGAERADDGDIQRTRAEREVGDVDDLVAGRVQGLREVRSVAAMRLARCLALAAAVRAAVGWPGGWNGWRRVSLWHGRACYR
jgi:hypothetical protein